jgi:peptidoglycan-associated lipoprotein
MKALRETKPDMKLAKFVTLLAVGLALSFGIAGCRKGPDKMTQIPGQRSPQPVEDKARPLDAGTPVDTATAPADKGVTGIDPNKGNQTGIPPAGGDFSNWKEDRETFHIDIVYFDFDKSNIKPSEVSKLENIARRMKSEFQGKAVRVEGNCDERGTEEYNRSLGDKRALSAREYLVRLGLDANMIPTVSLGEDKPADSAHNEAAWAKNRRCEFILLSPP